MVDLAFLRLTFAWEPRKREIPVNKYYYILRIDSHQRRLDCLAFESLLMQSNPYVATTSRSIKQPQAPFACPDENSAIVFDPI